MKPVTIILLAMLFDGKNRSIFESLLIYCLLFLVANPLSCIICDSKEDEHCPETWTRKDVLPVECGGPDGVQDARFCIKTIAVFGGSNSLSLKHLTIDVFPLSRCGGDQTFLQFS